MKGARGGGPRRDTQSQRDRERERDARVQLFAESSQQVAFLTSPLNPRINLPPFPSLYPTQGQPASQGERRRNPSAPSVDRWLASSDAHEQSEM